MYIPQHNSILIVTIFGIFTYILIAIAFVQKAEANEGLILAVDNLERITKQVQTTLQNLPPYQLSLKQGEVVAIHRPMEPTVDGVLLCNEKEIQHIKKIYGISFILSSQYDERGEITCTYEDEIIITANIENIRFPENPLFIDPAFLYPPQSALARINRETAFLKEIYTNSNYTIEPESFKPIPFQTRTSPYGEIRIYQNGVRKVHGGIDYGEDTGTPLTAIGDGRVVVAREFYYCGNMVVIDHGLDVFSIYCHLHTTFVREGENITGNTPIGTIGSSGLSTGPHLHFAMKINDAWVNPDSFMQAIQQFRTNF